MNTEIIDKPLMGDEFLAWFNSRGHANSFLVERIPFRSMNGWHFEASTGNIIHESGKFFKIEGIRVHSNFKGTRSWDQPVINQPEIGILGIITKKFNGIRHFLMQAKMEPGNVNINQLSPTVQATKSNYTQVHKGSQPLFLDYFLDRSKAKILVDQLQSEQGARFLRKRNRNMIVEVERDIVLPDDFCWLTLGQIKQLYKLDNFMNMDARSVLSCVRFVDDWKTNMSLEVFDLDAGGFSKDVFESMVDKNNSLHRRAEIFSWFTDLKTKYECSVESIPLNDVEDWLVKDDEIIQKSKNYFSIVAVSVKAGNREVRCWDQPLLKQASVGMIGFLAMKINNVMHVLIQAKVEPGFIDTIEMLPTVCFSDIEYLTRENKLPPFAENFMDCPAKQIRYSTILSEEGGRFYHSQNKYMVVEMDVEEKIDVPENYIWMTLSQLMEFAQYNNYLSVETRSLLSCLTFI